MSPINIPIKPPPRVNTANSVNGGGDDDDGTEREKGGEKEASSGRGGRVGGSVNTRQKRER